MIVYGKEERILGEGVTNNAQIFVIILNYYSRCGVRVRMRMIEIRQIETCYQCYVCSFACQQLKRGDRK